MFSLIKLVALLALFNHTLAAPLHSPSKRALPRLGGVNLAGCEFGINTDGWSGTSYCPKTDQISHFISKGANLIRIPFAWQYIVGNNQASTSLDAGYFAQFDGLVQASLRGGAYVMLDLHNYARWNSGIVGQGGPTNEQFASVWSLIAAKYKNEPKVIFGIMNEPHDVPDNTKWAASVQAAVNAIRSAGAKAQTIAIPGNFWAHADDWLNGKNAPLLNVKDPATNDNSLLILDVHKYLDGDGSGTNRECVTNGIDTWTQLQSFLRTNKRQAIISEIGGGNTASCATNLEQSLGFIAKNTAEYVGFAVWSAGAFDASYELSIVPQNGQDNNLFIKAVQPHLPGSGGAVAPAPSSSSARASSSAQASSSAAPTSSRAAVTTSRAPVTSSFRPPVASSSSVRPTSSSVRPSSSSKAPTPSSITSSNILVSSAAATTSRGPSTTSPSSTTGNLQKFTGTLGGIPAPAVTKTSTGYASANRTFNFLDDALNASCYAQMDGCQRAANQGGNKGDLTVEKCNAQMQACLQVVST